MYVRLGTKKRETDAHLDLKERKKKMLNGPEEKRRKKESKFGDEDGDNMDKNSLPLML